MPPSQMLQLDSLDILIVDVPFTPTDGYSDVGLGEVEVRKIDLCRSVG